MPASATIIVDLEWLARYLQSCGGTVTLDEVAREVIRQQCLGKPQWFLRKAVQEKLKELVGSYSGFSISYKDSCLVLTIDEGATISQAPCPDYPPPMNQPALFEMLRR